MMGKHVRLLLFVLLCTASLSPQQWRSCTGVVDGDTIVLDGNETIRLIGIDVPELNDQRSPMRQFAEDSRNFLKKEIEGKRIRLEFDKEAKDLYGRTLAYVYLDNGTFINAKLIQEGYAFAYVKYQFKYMKDFVQYEMEARDNWRGFWHGGREKPFVVEEKQPTVAPRANLYQQSQDTTVYITRTGKKYHFGNCRSLSKSKIPVGLKEAVNRGYTPCSVCRPPVLRELGFLEE